MVVGLIDTGPETLATTDLALLGRCGASETTGLIGAFRTRSGAGSAGKASRGEGADSDGGAGVSPAAKAGAAVGDTESKMSWAVVGLKLGGMGKSDM